MSRAHRGEQRALSQTQEGAGTAFKQSFEASHRLAKALSSERRSHASGQVAYLKKKEQQHTYVAEARKRPRPPLESVVMQQELLSDLRRDARTPTVMEESPEQKEMRQARHQDLLQDKKRRHDEAMDGFEHKMDDLAEERKLKTQDAAVQMRKLAEESDAQVDKLLCPLEEDTEGLGERTEEDVRGIMATLEDVTEARRQKISGFCADLEALDGSCRERSSKFMQDLAEQLTAAAYVVPGEIERIIEQKALNLNTALLENQKSVKMIEAKLSVQTLEKLKASKKRWSDGLLLWKQRRHRHTVDLVLERIRGNEFRQPETLVEILVQVRAKQDEAFKNRTKIVSEFFGMEFSKVSVNTARGWEEQNNMLNDRMQEAFDVLFAELKEFKKSLNTAAEDMLSNLAQELEAYDAKQEWEEHETVTDLIDANVRPHLRECLDLVANLLRNVTDGVTKQEETQHHYASQLITFFIALAKKQEHMKKKLDEFEVHYAGEIEDCQKDHEDEKERNEQALSKLHEKIEDCAHHEELDTLKQEAFDELDKMAVGYREHADMLLSIHNQYPDQATTFMNEVTENFCTELGLITEAAQLKAKEAAEAAAAAAAEEQPPSKPGSKGGTKAGAKLGKKQQTVAEIPILDGSEEPPPNEFPEWEGGAAVSKVFERLTLAKLREQLLSQGQLAPAAEAGSQAPSGSSQPVPAVSPRAGSAAAGSEVSKSSAPPEAEEGEDAVPTLADGTVALSALEFESEWIEERLGSTRVKVFVHLEGVQNHLKRIDVSMKCEEVRRDLDQELRRHTNRKGQVQVEWYVPRYAIITKHKDKFERHLVDIARKSQRHDDETEALFKEMEELEESYKDGLIGLREQLSDAGNLPTMTASERRASEMAKGFEKACQQIKKKLLNLATEAPEALQKENKNFLDMCLKGDERYSKSEILFYKNEMEALGLEKEYLEELRLALGLGGEVVDNDATVEAEEGALQKRMVERRKKVKALATQLDQKKKEPLREFMEHYEQASEALCALKGFGEKHGQPRRKAQERSRTLNARAARVNMHIEELCKYFTKLCEQRQDDLIEASHLPSCPLFQLQTFFKPPGELWVFTAELIGVLYIIVCALNFLGTHLEAFKPECADKYRLEGAPLVRVLREAESAVPEQDDIKKTEHGLREQCLMKVVEPFLDTEGKDEKKKKEIETVGIWGFLLKVDSFNVEVQAIVKASHDAYVGKGGTPEFMQEFLAEMQQSSAHARQEAARDIQKWCDTLRDDVLLGLGDALFGELTARALSELRRRTQEEQAVTQADWASFDKERAAHEQELNPGLSNPNAEAKLRRLIEAEAQRYKSTIAMSKKDRVRMATCLRTLCSSFVQRLAACFEAVIRIVDTLPLHSHFVSLPGDEQVEQPRMSIKRRMRRLQSNTNVDQWKDGLPERKWEGVQRFVLRRELSGGDWPPDTELPEAAPDPSAAPKVEEPPAPKAAPKKGAKAAAASAAPEAKKAAEEKSETTPAIQSFRSPMHKKLFERRNHYYEVFSEVFTAEVRNRNAELSDREGKEKAGQRNWQSMVRQLKGDTSGTEIEDPDEAPVSSTPPPAPEPPPPPPGKKK